MGVTHDFYHLRYALQCFLEMPAKLRLRRRRRARIPNVGFVSQRAKALRRALRILIRHSSQQVAAVLASKTSFSSRWGYQKIGTEAEIGNRVILAVISKQRWVIDAFSAEGIPYGGDTPGYSNVVACVPPSMRSLPPINTPNT